MEKENLCELLNHYIVYNDNEESYKNQILEFVAQNDIIFGKGNPNGHITTSAWIISEDRTSVLLTHHRKLDRWVQLGGHTEVGEVVTDGALREAVEESGLSSIKFLANDIFDVYVYKIPERKNEKEHFHYDIGFIFEANSNEKIIVSNESKDVKWIELKDIEKYTNDISVLRMADKTKHYL